MSSRQPSELLHWNMVHAHKTFKAGFDSILGHLANPPTHDLTNFLGYCEAWAQSIGCHHDSEGALCLTPVFLSDRTANTFPEEVVFPFLNRKLDFSGEVEEHKAIHAKLDEILAYIAEVRADPTKFDAAKLKASMDDFRTPLVCELRCLDLS